MTISRVAQEAIDVLSQGKPPCADIAICNCGTAWNKAALQDMRMDAEHCPDCGEQPVHVIAGEVRS